MQLSSMARVRMCGRCDQSSIIGPTGSLRGHFRRRVKACTCVLMVEMGADGWVFCGRLDPQHLVLRRHTIGDRVALPGWASGAWGSFDEPHRRWLRRL
jgi:hypothetical protein